MHAACLQKAAIPRKLNPRKPLKVFLRKFIQTKITRYTQYTCTGQLSYSHSSLLAIIILNEEHDPNNVILFKCTLQLQICLLSFQALLIYKQPTKLGSKLVDHDILERLS